MEDTEHHDDAIHDLDAKQTSMLQAQGRDFAFDLTILDKQVTDLRKMTEHLLNQEDKVSVDHLNEYAKREELLELSRLVNSRSTDKLPTLSSKKTMDSNALKAMENRLNLKVDTMFAKLTEAV